VRLGSSASASSSKVFFYSKTAIVDAQGLPIWLLLQLAKEGVDGSGTSGGKASLLMTMNASENGIMNDNSASMAERVNRNAGRRQRGGESFL
jgi:hypothetical protein